MTPVRLEPGPRGWVRGGTPIFSYIRRLGSFFGVQNFEFQYLGGGGFRILFFLGGGGGCMKILWIFFVG